MLNTQSKKRERPELLSPAGSPLALRAAIEGGADAIYIGGSAFNARMNAKNFDENELARAIELAHSFGARVYITANTLIFDREADSYLRSAESAYLLGADALIVADLGMAREIRRRIPIELHASTQLSGHNTQAAIELCKIGFSRMVLARETAAEDIASFCKNSPIESEVFVHGALCVSYSGQCLFSSIVGGRSGNRGECAQPCRLPYGRREGYPLSLKDLSLAEHITKLCEMGVSSFKIEGRMKSPEYVRDVTKVWRELIDAGRNASRSEMEHLARVFSRGGHTDGYFTGRVDSSMLGVRSESDKRESATIKKFEKIERKIPIELRARIKKGERICLEVRAKGASATAFGDPPELARTAPMDAQSIKKSLVRLGDTPYEASVVEVDVDGGLMVPVSKLNALRRAAVELLSKTCVAERRADDILQIKQMLLPSGRAEKKRTAVFYFPQNMPLEAKDFFNIIYIPLELYSKRRCDGLGVMLPEVIFDSQRKEVEELLLSAYKAGARDALVGNLGHIEIAKKCGYRVHGDIRLNVTNNSSMASLEELCAEDCLLSPELTLPQIRDIGGAKGVCVYGRLPLMLTEKCVGRELGDCKGCESGRLELCDRRGARFPVIKRYSHRSVIFNSVPVYMADRGEELKRAGVAHEHFIFSVESAKEAGEIILAYKESRAITDKCRRIK